MCFDPIGELGIARRPAHEPRLQILLGLFEIAPVVEPAQLLTTIVVGLAGQIVEGIAEEVHVTPLPHGLGQELPHRAPSRQGKHDQLGNLGELPAAKAHDQLGNLGELPAAKANTTS